MELTNIEKLLENYLKAETTLQEEQLLRHYFTSDAVAPHLQQYCILFRYFKQSQDEVCTLEVPQLKRTPKKRPQFLWQSLAASVALLVFVFIGKQQYTQYQQRQQFAQLKNTLVLVSKQLNKGNDAIYAVSDNLAKGTDAVSEISTFSKTFKTATKIINKTHNNEH